MGNPYAGMKPTPFAPAYQGILTNSNSNSYTTAYSSSANRSKFVDATDGGVHTVMNPMVGQDTTEKGSFSGTKATFSASNTMSKDTSNDIAFNESSFSTRNEHHPSSDICLDSSGTNVPMTNQNQTKTFQQLATERGISQWDSEILDERWLPANRNEQQPRTSKREITSKEIENVSRRHKRMESFLKELDDTEENMNSQLGIYRPDPQIWGLENTYPRYARALRGSQPTSE